MANMFLFEFPGEEIASDDLSPDDFYNWLRAMVSQVPITTQPSVGMFVDTYQSLVDAGEELLSIHTCPGVVSAGLISMRLAEDLLDSRS